MSISDDHRSLVHDGDPLDIAEEFVAAALDGKPWEGRDNYPYDDGYKSWVERGTGDATVRFIELPVDYLDCCKIELLLDAAQGFKAALERIAENAEAWHGPPPDMGHVRSLAVIATTAREALTGWKLDA